MRFNATAALILACLSLYPAAQAAGTIRTARPGQAIGAATVGAGYFQIQSGLAYTELSGNQSSQSKNFDNVIRYGLSEAFEVSAVLGFNEDKPTGNAQNMNGLSYAQVGMRYSLIDAPSGWIPAIAVQTRFLLPVGSSSFRPSQVAPIFIVATNHGFGTLSLTHNFKIAYDGQTALPRYSAVSNLGIPLGNGWSTFAEVYGNFKASYGSLYADTGLAYLVNDDLQFDIYGGGGRNRGTTELFASAGISWRTNIGAANHDQLVK